MPIMDYAFIIVDGTNNVNYEVGVKKYRGVNDDVSFQTIYGQFPQK